MTSMQGLTCNDEATASDHLTLQFSSQLCGAFWHLVAHCFGFGVQK